MKKLTLIACAVIALSCCACKTAETTEKTQIDYSKITVQGVLDKSTELRDNINTYKNAQKAASSATDNKSAADTLKDSAKEKYNEIKQKVSDEAAAWKETLKK